MNLLMVHKDDTEADLVNALRRATHVVLNRGDPYQLTIGGYDLDPRELYESPEVVPLSRRLVALGFMSPLIVTPPVDELELWFGWSAYELWLSSKGELGSKITVADMCREVTAQRGEFWGRLLKSNRLCDMLAYGN